MTSLSPNDRRTLLLGALAVGAILIVGKGVPAWRGWERAQVERASLMSSRLTRAETRERMMPSMRERVMLERARLDEARSYMIGALTPEAAASNLAAIIEADASDAGVAILTLALRPDTLMRAGFARVSVQLAAEADVTGLLEFLAALEKKGTPVAIRELTISQADPLAPTSKAETLRLDIVAETIAEMRKSAPGRKAG
jgi:type II secretion system (T2SS) protein M